jgi:hypothetical protein
VEPTRSERAADDEISKIMDCVSYSKKKRAHAEYEQTNKKRKLTLE